MRKLIPAAFVIGTLAVFTGVQALLFVVSLDARPTARECRITEAIGRYGDVICTERTLFLIDRCGDAAVGDAVLLRVDKSRRAYYERLDGCVDLIGGEAVDP